MDARKKFGGCSLSLYQSDPAGPILDSLLSLGRVPRLGTRAVDREMRINCSEKIVCKIYAVYDLLS